MSWTSHRAAIAVVVVAFFLSMLSFHFKSFWVFITAIGVSAIALGILQSAWRSFLLAFSSLFFSVAIADYVAGFFDESQKTHYDEATGYSKTYGKMTDLGLQANSGVHRLRKLSFDNEVVYDVLYTIGSDGFRVTRQEARKSNRINFFGCSFMFGEGLNDNQTLPYFVSRSIRDHSVKNFGFHGYGAHQAYSILTSSRDTSGTVNFLLTAPWHAVRSACKPKWTAGSPRYVLIGDEVRLSGKCRESDLTRGILAKALESSNIYKLILRARHQDAVSDEDIELYLALIQKIHQISRDRGQVFGIGFIKADKEFFRNTSFSNRRIFDHLRANSDFVIDLTLSDQPEGLSPKYFLHPLDRHPSELANRERALRFVDAFRTFLAAEVG